jgi:hypothetical protein
MWFAAIQPDMATMEDEGISDEIGRLEEKYQGLVFDTITKALTSNWVSFFIVFIFNFQSSYG